MKNRLLMAAAALATTGAVATWALATDVVVLHPATLRAQFTYTSEPVSSIQLYAQPVAGGLQSSRAVTPSGSPFTVDLTVEGGDGALGAGNPGVTYSTYMYTYFSGQASTYLYTRRGANVTVQNPSATTPDIEIVDMPLTVTHRVTGNVQVLNGKLTSLTLKTSLIDAGNNYRGAGGASFPAKPSSGGAWAPSAPGGSVLVYGTAYVEDNAGNASQRALSQQTITVAGPVTAPTWTIDLGNATTVTGVIGPAMPTALGGRYCYYDGQGAASGVHGSKFIPANGTQCVVALSPPATFTMHVSSYLGGPGSQYVSTPRHTFAASGGTRTENFNETHGTAILRPEVYGMIDPSIMNVRWGSSMQMVQDPNVSSSIYAAVDGYLSHVLPVGTWRTSELRLDVLQPLNPPVPLRSNMIVYNYNDPLLPLANVSLGGPADLGTYEMKLARTNVYFDVKEPAGQPQVNIRSPYIEIRKYDYDGCVALRRTDISAYGSNVSQPLSALGVVAPAGQYSLLARAEVNGSQVVFANGTIRFGAPIETGPGDVGVPINLTPDNSELELSLTFPDIVQEGYSSVVETPIGPEVPEKFKLSCDDTDLVCAPLYYDITTTATHEGSVTVCVKKKIFSSDNGLDQYLRLFHYDADEVTNCDPALDTDPMTPGCWENITQSVLDCSNPDNNLACGCADEACGSDPEANTYVFKVCGLTDGFSPFGLMELSRHRFTNEVDGVEYTGPDGPAALQSFTVPRTGRYRITATGAEGGHALTTPVTAVGGCGAEIAGTFDLVAGDELKMLVGQAGTSTAQSGGGGGGTFVVRNGERLVIAGGGGGVRVASTVNGRHGGVGVNGVPGSTSSSYSTANVAGGINGTGGSRSSGLGSGGGGWSGNGAADGTNGEGGFSFLSAINGGRGGKVLRCTVSAHGGYGGGGSGNGCYGGGGGGGNSGGGAGRVGGGGGSFNAGSSPVATSGVCTDSDHGMVIIESLD